MATATLLPTSIASSSNVLSGTIADIDEGTDAADAALVSLGGGAGFALVQFPTPAGPPTVGSGLQTFRFFGRRGGSIAGGIHVYQAGSLLLSDIINLSTINGTTNTLYTATWNASLLTDPSGAAVQMYLDKTGGGGVTRLHIDAVDWVVDYTVPASLLLPSIPPAVMHMLVR